MILESVENGPLLWPTIEENGAIRPKKYSELSTTEAIQVDCDVKETNIILQGLPREVYALVSNHKVAKELWKRIQLLMQGTSLTKQERECKLYDEFDKFAYKKGESLRLQISQSPRGIYINQSIYAHESLKKYGFESYDPVDTPMVEKSKLDEDKEGKAIDLSHYRGMISTIPYLTANRPDLQFAICMCARERIEVLINKLGMRSFTPETLKQLTDEVDE
nr:uncharacterized mitochondrial protein AtMg00810-like [Tanacetum cinerariifolium]